MMGLAAVDKGTMSPNEARRLTLDLIHRHNLLGWKVTFDRAVRRAGQCNYTKREISLSLPLMRQRSYAETLETITHEIAHALTPGHHHDRAWQLKHIELGGKGSRTFHIDRHDPKAKYHGTCPHGKIFNRYKEWSRPGQDQSLGCNCKTGRRRTPETHAIRWVKN